MSTTSNRSIVIAFSSEIEYTQEFAATVNPDGSGQNQLVNLLTGNNTITVPDDAFAVTILMPLANDVQVKLKGVNGDTGINLSLLDPTSIGLESVSSFVLNAAEAVTVRLIYS